MYIASDALRLMRVLSISMAHTHTLSFNRLYRPQSVPAAFRIIIDNPDMYVNYVRGFEMFNRMTTCYLCERLSLVAGSRSRWLCKLWNYCKNRNTESCDDWISYLLHISGCVDLHNIIAFEDDGTLLVCSVSLASVRICAHRLCIICLYIKSLYILWHWF